MNINDIATETDVRDSTRKHVLSKTNLVNMGFGLYGHMGGEITLGILMDEDEGGDQEEEGDLSSDEGSCDDKAGDTNVEVCISSDSSEQGGDMSKEKIREDGDGVEDVNLSENDVGDVVVGGNDVGDDIVGRNVVRDVVDCDTATWILDGISNFGSRCRGRRWPRLGRPSPGLDGADRRPPLRRHCMPGETDYGTIFV
ncbi:hypothetical protein Sjap_013213 [Stephania japonica]|uniref:Uncharacterized protein n=1 Tax=Stephania japonica TaxID=461633 RepID=A0AAP0P136_9MAGN